MSQCWTFTSSFALKLIYYFQGTDLCHLFFFYIAYQILRLKHFFLVYFHFIFLLHFFFCLKSLYFNPCLAAYFFIKSKIVFAFITSESYAAFTIPFSKVLVVRRFWDPALLLLLRKHIYFCQDFFCFTI